MFNFSKKEKKEPKDFKGVLKELRFLGDNLNRVSADLEIIKKLQDISIQKVGMVRFNPFREVRGDRWFSLALLDKSN